MPRVYFHVNWGMPFYSNERGVGIGMTNERDDVMLIQYLLRAMLHSGKEFLMVRFTRPSGAELHLTGVWDETSKVYLAHWELCMVKKDAALFGVGGTTQPGKLVPYSQGGKKIRWMNTLCLGSFGREAFKTLRMTDVNLPSAIVKQLLIA